MVYPDDLRHILSVFGLSKRDLARALNVAPYTVDRWEKGAARPAGLQYEVLGALHAAALTLDADRHDSAGWCRSR
jgi:DNA-binding transcriptional regulator YiaG